MTKEKFIELANKHLIALESYKIDKEGNKPIEIFGLEKLYEALNIDSVVGQSEQLFCGTCNKYDTCKVCCPPTMPACKIYGAK